MAARVTLAQCERKLAKHLDGLEAGIPADVIAPRIAATQREMEAAKTLLELAPRAQASLRVEEVIETLSSLRSVLVLLAGVDPANRAALYRAFGLTVTYRRVGNSEQVTIMTSLQSVELEHVGESASSADAQVHNRAWSWIVSEGVSEDRRHHSPTGESSRGRVHNRRLGAQRDRGNVSIMGHLTVRLPKYGLGGSCSCPQCSCNATRT